MRAESWKHIAEAIGVAAIVASLVFVGLQLRQEDDVARLELIDRSTDQQRELQKWITEKLIFGFAVVPGQSLAKLNMPFFRVS